MKTVALMVLLFTSIQLITEEISIYDRDRSLNFLTYAKFICTDNSSERIKDKRPTAWVGYQSRNFVFSVFEKHLFLVFSSLVDEELSRFLEWSILPRKPPDA